MSINGLKDNKEKRSERSIRTKFEEAIKWNDVNIFRQILTGLNVSKRVNILEISDPYTHKSIFELICGTSEFILECIELGCNTNKQNQKCGKRPLGFAIEALSSNNLEALLSDTSMGVDCEHSFQYPFTSINYFVEQISDNNFNDIYSCIELIVKHCADVNMPAQNGKAPIQNILEYVHLVKENKKKLIQCFLTNAKFVDVDIVRTKLMKLFPDSELPPINNQINETWNLDRFFECLKNENEIEFLRGISFIAMNKPNRLIELFTVIDTNKTLLTLVIEKGLKHSAERMLRLGADLNVRAGNFTPVEHAINAGNWEMLELLLNSSKLDLNQSPALLPIATKYTHIPTTNGNNYDKCFELLVNHSKIDVNAEDTFGCSALHYAIQNNDSKVILDLLKRGAYIGIEDASKKPSISKIDPQLLEKHFDSCVTTTGKNIHETEYELVFNLANLIPSQPKHNERQCFFKKCIPETKAIKRISKCAETKHLLRHPLIEGLLFSKFDGFKVILFVNLLVFVVFSAVTVAIISGFLTSNVISGNEELSENVFMCFGVYLFTGLILFFREVAQFIFSPWNYLKSIDNYLELALIPFSYLSVRMSSMYEYIFEEKRWEITESAERSETIYKSASAVTIFLITYEMFSLLGSIPFWSFSTHYVMFKTVTKNFLKCLLMYVIIIVGFTLTFFISFNDRTNSSINSSATSNFGTVGLSLFKVSTMAIGEMDASNIDFNHNPTNYIVFACFMLLVTVVLANLLNGLAVSDIQTIILEAKQTELIQLCRTLSRFENGFFSIVNRIGLTKLKSNVIRVRPNEKNRIVDPNRNKNYGSARMSDSIVKDAFRVLKRVEMEKEEEIEKQRIEKRFANIEKLLEKVLLMFEKEVSN